MHILQNISGSKGNKAIKFGQLIEYNMRNIVLEKSYLKYNEELYPDPFLKKQNWAYLWIKFKVLYGLFLLYA